MPFATIHNARMFYRLQGNAGRPVLILSHSISTDHAMWDLQVEDLLPHFQILRYDTRGHGASDATAGEYSIEMLGKDILALADAVGDFAICLLRLVAGWSHRAVDCRARTRARHPSCVGQHVAAVRTRAPIGKHELRQCTKAECRQSSTWRCNDSSPPIRWRNKIRTSLRSARSSWVPIPLGI